MSRVVLLWRRELQGDLVALSRNHFCYRQDGVLVQDESVVRGQGKAACRSVIDRLQLPGVFQIPDKPTLVGVTEGFLWWKKSIQLRVFVVGWSEYGEAKLTDFPYMDPIRYYPHGHRIERELHESSLAFAA